MFSQKKSVLSKLILPILMVLFLFSISGCGNKPSSPASTPTPPPSQNAKPVVKPGVVTYENYLNIKFDTTYDDVKSILGEGIKDELSAEIVDYRWNDQGKTITIRTLLGKVVSKSESKLGKTTTNLTEEQFKKITTGMTFDQVTSILGPDYQEVNSKKSDNAIERLVAWVMPDSKNIKIKFQDDKVTKTYNDLKK